MPKLLCLLLAAAGATAAQAASFAVSGLDPYDAGPDAQLSSKVRLALGLESEGKWAEAAVSWQTLGASDTSSARSWFAARGVDAALAADPANLDLAAKLVATIDPKHPAAPRVRVALARQFVERDPPRALELLEAIADPAPDTMLLLADVRVSNGDGPGARALYRKLYLTHPHTDAGAATRKHLPGFPKKELPSYAQEVERLERLLGAHRNKQVIEDGENLLRSLEPNSGLGCRTRFAIGKAHRKERNYHQATDTLKPVVKDCGKDRALKVKALYLWASAVSIAQKDPAIPIYRRLHKLFPKHGYADDALFFIADLHIRAGRTKKARQVMREQVELHPDGDYAAEAQWRLFWLDRMDKKSVRGLQHLDGIVAGWGRGTDRFDVERALYWKARVVVEEGDQAKGLKIYQRIVDKFPLSYHSLQALARIGELEPGRAKEIKARFEAAPQKEVDFELQVRAAFRKNPSVVEGIHLLRLGLPDEAARVLIRAGGEAKGESEVLLLALALDRAGDPHQSHWLIRTRARGFDQRYPAGATWRVWRAAYPLAYQSEVEAAAHEWGIPPHLLHALIREESALEADVISWAGAIGLGQMMPYTARDVARRMGHKGKVTVKSLQDPAFNLRLSARYLSELMKLMGQQVALTISSYNAGERTVGVWRKRRRGWALDEWIEAISIAQTRRYTRRVLRSYGTYRFLYGHGDDRFLSLPAKVE